MTKNEKKTLFGKTVEYRKWMKINRENHNQAVYAMSKLQYDTLLNMIIKLGFEDEYVKFESEYELW